MKTLNKIAIIWFLCISFLLFSFFVYGRHNFVSLPPSSNNTPVIASDSAAISPSAPATYYPVVKVVDGDTIDVLIENKIIRIRLLGINTPETVDPRKPVQCFGQEASDYAKKILTDKKVRLETDSTQDNIDIYGRLLRYIYLEDNIFFNKLMIENGYAFEYTYKLPYKYRDQFIEAQKEASSNNLGLWAPQNCNGQLKPKNK